MERYERENQLVGQITDLQRQLRDAQATVEALQRERDFFETAAATANRMRVDTERALDAEREKAKNDATAYRKLSEQWNATDLELSQLQALVRAFFTSEDKWAVAYRELERLGYTLDTTTTVRVEDRSRMDPAKVLSVRLDDLLRVLDRAADHFVIPCQSMLSLGTGGCPNCLNALELKSELLKMASMLRAEAQEKMKTGMPFGAKSKIEAKTEANNRKRIK